MVPHQRNQTEQLENISLPAAFPQHKGNFGELKKIVALYLVGFENLPNVVALFQFWK